MKYCFGPVPSRRLGRSLGVDILPAKTCNLNCVYCEVGPTRTYSCERREYIPTALIKEELREVLVKKRGFFDTLTFTGSGEPTLHAGLGELLQFAREYTDRPLAVLTNSTLLGMSEVRRALCHADILLPSLDAVTFDFFRRVNRPAASVSLMEMIEGLVRLRGEFSRQIWMEILFVRGINHGPEHLAEMAEVLQAMRPDRTQLNTVVRPPAEAWARPLSRRELREVRQALGAGAEVVVDSDSHFREGVQPLLESEILDMLRRRPLSLRDLQGLLALDAGSLQGVLNRLGQSGLITAQSFDGVRYYMTAGRVGERAPIS